jgi:hypothetical protein
VDPNVCAYTLYHDDLVLDEAYRKAKLGALATVDLSRLQKDHYGRAVEYFL